MTNIELIKEISWVLSLASAKHKLDIPGEYTWAFPPDKFGNFNRLQDRSRSIFSSGNSIKDPVVIDFVQNVNIAKFLLDPWTVEKFEADFRDYIKAGDNYKLQNFDLFKYIGFSAGTQESFLNF